MTDPTPTRRRVRPTPAWLIYGLLVVEGLLWLSERYRWFWFNEKKGWTVLIAVAMVGVVMLVMLAWFFVSLIFRSRFQFSIRSLLVLVVAGAVPCSWLAVEMKKAREQGQIADVIRKLGGVVNYDWEFDADGNQLLNPRAPGPAWLRNLVGADCLQDVESVYLVAKGLTGVELEPLRGLNRLRTLNLTWTGVTDAGLVHLENLSQLKTLYLGGTGIGDAGIVHLKGLKQLKLLSLSATPVTDAGLAHLKELSQLKTLCVDETHITAAGVKKLQQALPKCTIER